jgi:hypothetical protein
MVRLVSMTDAQETVGDGSEVAPVRMAACSERRVAAATKGVVLGGHTRPMIDRSSQTAGACLTHFHATRFAAPLCNRRHPGQGTQGTIISRVDGLKDHCEQRGQICPI